MAPYLRGYSWQRDLLIAGSVVLVFAFVGPFGTFDDMSFYVRLAYWAIMIYGCGVFFWLGAFLIYKIKIFKNIPSYFLNLITVFFASIFATMLLAYNNFIFRSFETTPINLSLIPQLSDLKPERWGWLWLTIFVIMLIISTINFFSHFGKSLSAKEDDKKEVNDLVIKTDPMILFFLKKLPKKIGTDLISLSSHDHYVDVVTKEGSHLVHMKFSKAIDLLKNYPGVRIHRSHWVSLKAIKTVKKTGRSRSLKLSDGRVLPISKKYEKAVS